MTYPKCSARGRPIKKNGFGGLEGRGLKRGDRLSLCQGSAAPLPEAHDGFGAWHDDLDAGFDPPGQPVTVRVVPAAEFDAFTSPSRELFFSNAWTLTPDANRMGYRFSGEKLNLGQPRELLSHGIVPGTVQVPPSGQPIIQLADANTCGGYPKIATVIEADLWRLGQLRVGQALRFALTDIDSGLETLRLQRALTTRIRQAAVDSVWRPQTNRKFGSAAQPSS
ncbi:hypothetical protein QO058_20840 [Bosea vestrisii]|uniref:5-oxoprolinase subunit C family protein n=1 Tax=Bosea vestrisii TaxID=151416 RepID=UPI0024E00D69|nr:hypothetical protein [Bosea vestrisii]WID95220.1 hypothetical protein QO058_20840 [Bosea vestrisii]